jgi:PAS domain S-box-containing protein
MRRSEPAELNAPSCVMDNALGRLVDALPGCVWTALPDGHCDFVNERWREYTGLGLEAAAGERWLSAVHPEDLSNLQLRWRAMLASGEAGELEARLRGRDGTYRWFSIASRPLRDDSGKLVKWCGLNTDIDHRKQAPKDPDAIDSGERNQADGTLGRDADLRSIIDTIPMTAWSTGPDGYCDFVNQRWLDYAGLELNEVRGWGWGTVIHPDDLDGLVAAWRACLASGAPVHTEARMRRFDGTFRWFLFLGNPLRDEAGTIVKWFGTNVDIEDRKRAEDALRASERNLIQIINTIPTAAWSTRPDGYCDFLSDRWLDYAGFTLEQAIGWNWAAAIHPEDAAALGEYWRACLASGTPVDTEARMRRFDGEYRWFLFRANPLRDASGGIVKWYGTNVDIEDRKRADEALQASERNLVQIINTIPTTAWSTRPDGYCDFLSDRWLDYAGFTTEEALGWNWGTVIHPDDAKGLIDYWQGCLASGTPVDTEARMRRFDGEYRWFLFRANPLRDASGTIVKWYGTNVDIEDRKQADYALRASEHNLSLIINTIPMLAWSTRPDGFCDFLNQRWLEYAGMSAEEARGWAWAAAIHPDDAQELGDYWQAALSTGTPVDTEVRMRRFDGEYRWFLFRANPLHDESGNVVRWYGTNVDIEDRKRAVEELRRSEVLLAEGQRVSQTGSFYWRVDTDEIRSSEELYRILELDRDTPLTFARLAAQVHPEDIASLNEQVAQARNRGVALDTEVRLKVAGGAVKYLRMTADGALTRDGELEYVGAIQDVTERRRSEEALANVRSELAYMTRVASMGALTASIAHEVNQPLSGIITNANTCLRMLAADPPNIEGAVETARRTIRDGNRASEVISRLRALFAKKSTGTEPVDLNEATREVIALSVNELQRNRVSLRTEFASDLPLITGDRIQLQQVILNLLMNASAAMSAVEDRPRRLVIRTERDAADSVRLSVQDAGVGITAEDSDRLFEAFYTTKSTGMGIGLSVSRSIIENHEGRLWATANEGPGATFSFSIPRTHASAGTSDESRL